MNTSPRLVDVSSSDRSSRSVQACALDLDACTDPPTLRALLQARLPGFKEGLLRIDALRVSRVRRSTSRHRNTCPLSICCELDVSDLARGASGTQRLFCRVFRAGHDASGDLQDRTHLVRPAFGEPFVHLRDVNMAVWAFPNDPDLPQLTALLDLARRDVLPGAAKGAPGALAAELVRYEPQQRATLRFTLDGNGRRDPRVLFAKTFADERGHDIHRRFEYFWQLAVTDREAPLVAQPLGYNAAMRTLWQAQAPGTPLRDELDGARGPRILAAVARALALVHAAPPALAASAGPRSITHWRGETRRREIKLARAAPELADSVARVNAAIDAHAARETARPLGVIHGDFHPEQIWAHEGRVVLFDFDEFTLGDPMEDLALFALKLEQRHAAPELIASFIAAYAECSPRRFDAQSLRWHLVVQALLQASRAFVYQQPGWRDEITRRVVAAEARVADLERGVRS